jgi:formylglycine-generating enzyme required for sulfatase activity
MNSPDKPSYVTGFRLVLDREWEGDAVITDAASLTALYGYTAVNGSVTIENTDLIGLAPLRHLERVAGSILVNGNDNLTDLEGFNRVRDVGGDLTVSDNLALTLIGFDLLCTVDGFTVTDNPLLCRSKAQRLRERVVSCPGGGISGENTIVGNDDCWSNSIGMTFKPIPVGTFLMGSPDGTGGINGTEAELGRYEDEVLHEVTLTQPFYMQMTEVTQSQWQSIMGNNPAIHHPNCPNCPVESLSSNDIQAFIDKLNTLGEGTFRLPTEAEWEYAARAGTTTAFPSGPITEPECSPIDPNLDAIGWYCGNAARVSHIVGGKQPNAWGLFDMHGNTWEVCSDWYGDYPEGPETDPTGPAVGDRKVYRGGSIGWARFNRSACRNAQWQEPSHDPLRIRYHSGFRLVRED